MNKLLLDLYTLIEGNDIKAESGNDVPNNLTAILIIIAVLLVLAIILAISYLTFGHKYFSDRRDKKDDFNIRSYTYDYFKKTFICFDRSDMKHVKTFSEEEFYCQFRRADTYRIKNWFDDIIKEKDYSNTLQVDVKIDKRHQDLSSLLCFTSINRDKFIIHFDSQLLPFSFGLKNYSKNVKKLPLRYFLKSEQDCQEFLKGADADVLGAIYYLKIYVDKDHNDQKEEIKLEMISHKIAMIVSRYLSKKRKMIRLSNEEFVIVDTASISKLMTINRAVTIYTAIQQFINTDCEDDTNIRIAIGLSIGTLYHGDYYLGKDQAKRIADAIIDGKITNERVSLYSEDFFKEYERLKNLTDSVESLIKNSTFRIYFQAVLDIKNASVPFYMIKIVPYGVNLQDFLSILQIAKNIKNGLSNLINGVLEKIEAICALREVNLAIEIPYVFLDQFVSIANKRKKSNIHYILIVKETGLIANSDDPSIMIRKLRSYKKNNYKIGLMINNITSELRNKVLKLIDYFFVPDIFTTKMDDFIQLQSDLRTIKTNYTIENIPLVYLSLKDKDDMEMCVINGAKILQCDSISLPSSRLEDIQEDELEQLRRDLSRLSPELDD